MNGEFCLTVRLDTATAHAVSDDKGTGVESNGGRHMTGIGLLNEKPLHASLKQWYARPTDQIEVQVDGFIIDIVRDALLLEIQTGNLASIKSKLANLAGAHRVRLIQPIAREKWIVKLPRNGRGAGTRRRSPRRGRVEDLFWELVSFPQLLLNPNFSLEVLLIREEAVWRYAGRRSWRRRGWVVAERRLLEVVERRVFEQPADWRALVPDELRAFTARDLAEAIGIRRQLAQRMVYCLRHGGLITLAGKEGRAYRYRVAGA